MTPRHGLTCGCSDCAVTRLEKGERVQFCGDLPRAAEALLRKIIASPKPYPADGHFVTVLEEQGYVEQVYDPAQPRRIVWLPTDTGYQYFSNNEPLTGDEPTERLNSI